MRDKKGAEKDYYWAMTIEEDIKSGKKRKANTKGDRKEAPTTGKLELLFKSLINNEKMTSM